MRPTVLTVVGTRPQFVKAAALSRALRGRFTEVLVHTGQHYDRELSAAFFEDLDLAPPDVTLDVGSAGHGPQTARMRAGLVAAIRDAGPAAVIVHGDTNSTLAGALAAAIAGAKLAHVEAGLRSGNLAMPEEVNRIAADHLADLDLAPTAAAMENLAAEGLRERAVLTGDVMLDACLTARGRARPGALGRHGLEPGRYAFATVHRAENTDRPSRLEGIAAGLARVGLPVLLPLHPRTRLALARHGIALPRNVVATAPLGYAETLALLDAAALVLTDSGGLQKEAWFLGTPCVTLREETEWPETLEGGWNRLAGTDPERIEAAAAAARSPTGERDLGRYGGGRAAERIVAALAERVGP